MTQIQLGLLANYDRHYIGVLERGLRIPTLPALFRLARVLGASAETLVADTQSSKRPPDVNSLAKFIAVQLTTDGHKAYLEAGESAFGSQIDYAQLVKLCPAQAGTPERKYSPENFCGTKVTEVSGSPDPAHISTSYVERQNLTMRRACGGSRA